MRNLRERDRRQRYERKIREEGDKKKKKRSIFERIVSPDPVRCRIAYGYVWSLDRRLIVSRVAWQDPLSKLDIRTVGCLARFPLLSTLQILPHLPSLRFPSLRLSISRCDPDTDSSCFAGKFWRFSLSFFVRVIGNQTIETRRDVSVSGTTFCPGERRLCSIGKRDGVRRPRIRLYRQPATSKSRKISVPRFLPVCCFSIVRTNDVAWLNRIPAFARTCHASIVHTSTFLRSSAGVPQISRFTLSYGSKHRFHNFSIYQRDNGVRPCFPVSLDIAVFPRVFHAVLSLKTNCAASSSRAVPLICTKEEPSFSRRIDQRTGRLRKYPFRPTDKFPTTG